MAIHVIETVIATAVATDGTIDFPYPSGVVEADIVAGGEVLGLPSLQNVLDQAADTFTVAYGSSPATVTYKADTTIPAGSTVRLQIKTIDEATADDNIPAATETARGGVLMADNVAEAAGANPTAAEFKALLDALIASGAMAAS